MKVAKRLKLVGKERVEGIPVKHFNEKQDLLLRHGRLFPTWACSLHEGFSVFLYGFGSKKVVLSAFMTYLMEVDTEAAVVEVIGYSPHFTLKELLIQVSQAAGLTGEEEALNISGSKRSVAALAKRVVSELRKSDRSVFLFVHNIEGQNIRGEDCQEVLARLAELPNVYLVASADNASVTPLLWDQKLAGLLNFHYFHVPTYCSYEDELMYQDDIAFEENDGRRLQAASVVLSSLTQTARAVFRELGESQIAGTSSEDGGAGSGSGSGGMQFAELFTSCREQLILSNEITLRSHLEEFIDHDLVCMQDSPDSRVTLYKIPLRTSDIERLMDLCV